FKGMSEDETRQFFEDTLEFVKDEYGAENIMYATVHLDEKTPHMHFGFVPLTKDGRLSAKEVLGNKKKMSLLQDKFNDYVNEKGYKLEREERAIETERKHVDMNNFKQKTEYHKRELEQVQNEFNTYVNEKGYKLEREERAIETERKHVDMNNFKQQTEYHKRELEQVQNDFNASLEKWDKARQLNLQREKDEVAPIIARNTGDPMPDVEIKGNRFVGARVDPAEVEELQEWGRNAVSLIRKQQESMNERDKTIENLQEIIKMQDKQVEQRAKNKYKRDYERFKTETADLKQQNNHLQAKNYDLHEENKELRGWKEKTIDFMKE